MQLGPYHLAIAASKNGGLRCGRGTRGRRGNWAREAASLMEVFRRSRREFAETVVMSVGTEVIGVELISSVYRSAASGVQTQRCFAACLRLRLRRAGRVTRSGSGGSVRERESLEAS